MKWILALGLALAGSASQAQVYRCDTGNGFVFSDKPCEATKQAAVGGAQPHGPSAPQPAVAPSYRDLMSAGCASMPESQRSANTRAAHRGRRTYESDCRDEERRAREYWQQATPEQRRNLEQARREVQSEAEAMRNAEVCGDLRDVIRVRAQQPGAATDPSLARYKQQYAERCDRRG